MFSQPVLTANINLTLDLKWRGFVLSAGVHFVIMNGWLNIISLITWLLIK